MNIYKDKYLKYKKKYLNLKYGGSDGNSDNDLKTAITSNKYDEVKKMIDGKNINKSIDEYGRTPLQIAALLGHTEIVKLLINDNKININQATSLGNTPLLIASYRGNTDIASLLIDKKAAIEKANNQGETPLMIASRVGDTKIVKMLISKGAKINKAADDGATPLYIASGNGKTDTVKLLIEGKATLNKADNRGVTPLMRAAISDHMTIVRLLVESGADTTIRSDRNKTAAEWAKYYRWNDPIAEYLDNVRFNPSARNERGELYNVQGRARRAAIRDLVDKAGFSWDVMGVFNQLATGKRLPWK